RILPGERPALRRRVRGGDHHRAGASLVTDGEERTEHPAVVRGQWRSVRPFRAVHGNPRGAHAYARALSSAGGRAISPTARVRRYAPCSGGAAIHPADITTLR